MAVSPQRKESAYTDKTLPFNGESVFPSWLKEKMEQSIFWKAKGREELLQIEHSLIESAQSSDPETSEAAREALVLANIPLVLSVAQRYNKNGTDLEDLLQEGCSGLIKAINKFDLSKRVRFTTYATRWVYHEIMNSTFKGSTSVYMRGKEEKNLKAVRLSYAKMDKSGSQDDLERVSQETGIPLEDVKAYMNVLSRHSLDDPIREGESGTMQQLLKAHGEHPISAVIQADVEEQFLEKIAKANLTKREAEVVKLMVFSHRTEVVGEIFEACTSKLGYDEDDVENLRSGLMNSGGPDGETIAQVLGINRERVRQLKNAAMKKLEKQGSIRRLSTEVELNATVDYTL